MAKRTIKKTQDEKIEEAIENLTNTRKIPVTTPTDFVSSGSTLINLACTGHIDRALFKGGFFLFWGDSSSGKTWLAQSVMAEAANNPNFDDYQLIYDASENGVQMNVEAFFGKKYASRMTQPFGDSSSRTLTDMYSAIKQIAKNGPFIYVEDSFDALQPEVAADKDAYGLAKAKQNSSGLRDVTAILEETKSIMIGISQSRDYIGFGMKDKTRSGGKALKFYAQLEIITSVRGDLLQYANGKMRKVGNVCKMHIEKNRTSGVDQTFDIPIHNSFGIDDVGSCIDYLVEEKKWKKKASDEEKGMTDKTQVTAPDFEYEGTRGGLVKMLEETNQIPRLRELVAETWEYVQDLCVLNRRPRYE